MLKEKNKLILKHPINGVLKSLKIPELKKIVMKINMNYDQSPDAMRKKVAKNSHENGLSYMAVYFTSANKLSKFCKLQRTM